MPPELARSRVPAHPTEQPRLIAVVERDRGPALGSKASCPSALRTAVMRLQFPIAWLLAAIGCCGVAFAALRSATDWWASIVFTATLIGLSFSALYAVFRKGPRRAFWAAFAAFGSGAILLAFGPGCETSIRPRLLTTRLLDSLFLMVHPNPDPMVRVWDAAT